MGVGFTVVNGGKINDQVRLTLIDLVRDLRKRYSE